MINITVPSPGESVVSVTLAAWLVENGAYVTKNQEIAEIDSDKATLSISAPEAGVITMLLQAGDQAGVGDVIGQIDTEAVAVDVPKPQGEPDPVVPDLRPDQGVSISNPEHIGHPSEEVQESPLHFSPLAKAYMHSEGLTREDVIKMMHQQRIRKADLVGLQKIAGESQVQEIPDQSTGDLRTERRETMSPLRLKLSQRLVAVKQETAMLTTFNELDMSEILKIKTEYGQEFAAQHGARLGMMAFFTKAVTMALRDFPRINAFIDKDEIVYHDFVDVSIAVSAPKGLVVPVVRNAHRRSLPEIELEIRRLAEKARNNKLTLEEMTGGTFTITNGGVFGSMLSTPIINPPQSAILGMHNIVDRPVAVQGKVEIRPVMYVALSYDHRIIDGRESVGFLVRVKEMIENPVLMTSPVHPYRGLLGI
jgi:2-oxoglutarate dehydrogenase E2 component (dihydrolipoamide succinyltransferase)